MAVLFHRLDDDRLIAMLKQGGVGVLPTDTVYGLVCLAANQSSVERLFGDIKPREHKPGTVVGATLEQFVQLGVKKRYLTAVEQFWPGPVSVEVPHGVAYLHRGTGRQAFRVPDNEPLRTLLASVGALQTTSANAPDQPTAGTIEQAQRYFGDKVDFYVDGGDRSNQPVSTVIRVIDDAIEVVRQGAAHVDAAGRVLRG